MDQTRAGESGIQDQVMLACEKKYIFFAQLKKRNSIVSPSLRRLPGKIKENCMYINNMPSQKRRIPK
jgi:hypothetical protein